MLHQHERLALEALAKGAKNLDELCTATALKRDQLIHALLLLKERNAATLTEKETVSCDLTPEGALYNKTLLPELRLLQKAQLKPVDFSSLEADERAIGLPWALRNGWIKVGEADGKKRITATDSGSKIKAETH